MKEQRVRVNNYTLSTRNKIYSVVQKGHKTKSEYPNGDYSTKKNRTSRLKLKLTKKRSVRTSFKDCTNCFSRSMLNINKAKV